MKSKERDVKKSLLVASVIASCLCVSSVSLAAPTVEANGFASPNAKKVGASAVAVGANADATGQSSVAVGDGSKTADIFNVAIGSEAKVISGLAGIAIGGIAEADKMGAIALGFGTEAKDDFTIAMGLKTKVVPGKKLTDVSASTAIGMGAEIQGGTFSIAVGPAVTIVDTAHATAMGVGAYIGAPPVAAGEKVVTGSDKSGHTTVTKNEDGTYTITDTEKDAATLKEKNGEAYGAAVYGHRSSAFGLGAVATGMYSTAIGDDTVAVGKAAKTYAEKAVSIGAKSSATKMKATALGYYSDAQVEESVSLGYFSTADRDKEMIGFIPYATVTDKDSLEAFVKETNTSKETWQATKAAVSIGDTNNKVTRQIINVAAGTKDTDAVNVAQLKRLTVDMKSLYGDLGGAIKEMSSAVKEVGASAAAIGALRPLPYTDGDKMSLAAGVGSYQGTHAVALGGFYYLNKDQLISLGASLGAHHMVNLGVSFRVGKEKTKPMMPSADVMSEIQSLKSENTALKLQVEQDRAAIEELQKKVAMLVG